MIELREEKDINGLIKAHLEAYSPNIREFCLLAIGKAQELPVPDIIEILRASAKDFLGEEIGTIQ